MIWRNYEFERIFGWTIATLIHSVLHNEVFEFNGILCLNLSPSVKERLNSEGGDSRRQLKEEKYSKDVIVIAPTRSYGYTTLGVELQLIHQLSHTFQFGFRHLGRLPIHPVVHHTINYFCTDNTVDFPFAMRIRD
jgi:hypothetical protein